MGVVTLLGPLGLELRKKLRHGIVIAVAFAVLAADRAVARRQRLVQSTGIGCRPRARTVPETPSLLLGMFHVWVWQLI